MGSANQAISVAATNSYAECAPPAWVRELFTNGTRQSVDARTNIAITHRTSSQYVLVTARLPQADGLSDDAFRARTKDCYAAVAGNLGDFAPARFWNHIPRIHAPAGNDLDRYMIFNAGRYDAFLSWFGGESRFDAHVATASGIGHHGPDLVIHCLATNQPIQSIDNPRQIRPYRYSKRFGPQPPCFARATRSGDYLFVGGTASVRGEDSKHEGDLDQQTVETIANLDALLHAAGTTRKAFGDLRVYYPRPADAQAITQSVQAAFPKLHRAEFIRADLCRKELLIEIEGLAQL